MITKREDIGSTSNNGQKSPRMTGMETTLFHQFIPLYVIQVLIQRKKLNSYNNYEIIKNFPVINLVYFI